MTFISGVAYALSYSETALRASGLSSFYCLPEGMRMNSGLLIRLLNENLAGDVTADLVANMVFLKLAEQYACEN